MDKSKLIWKNKFFSLGLTGSVGSGKTTAAGFFREEGARVENADDIAKSIFERKDIQKAMIDYFGNEITDANGTVDRSKVARRIFSNSKDREFLNGLIHPHVREELKRKRIKTEEGTLFVYDVPLLFETDQDHEYDLTLLITAPDHIRSRRTIERNGWTEEEFEKRNISQLSQENKASRADLVYSNDGNLEEMHTFIKKLYNDIMAQSPGQLQS